MWLVAVMVLSTGRMLTGRPKMLHATQRQEYSRVRLDKVGLYAQNEEK